MGEQFAPAFPTEKTNGMNTLTLISALALPGVITAKPEISKEDAAKEAVAFADALLDELKKRHAPSRQGVFVPAAR